MERAELSKKNEYWIPKERYYELKHFCRQYPWWRLLLSAAGGYAKAHIERISCSLGDPTLMAIEKREKYLNYLKVMEETAKEVDPVIGKDILRGVTTGLSYDVLNVMRAIPCCKDIYYELYHKFFWLLDKRRDA